MGKLEMLKTVGGLMVSVGVGAIVSNIIKVTTPANVGKITKACIGAGSWILIYMTSEKAVKYAEDKFDETVERITHTVDIQKVDY